MALPCRLRSKAKGLQLNSDTSLFVIAASADLFVPGLKKVEVAA
jgi:hypothetical protein